MIRNVVLVKLADGADREEVAAIQDGLRGLQPRGALSYTIGDDLGLRDGNWSFAIVADFDDEAAYREYDTDAEHNRLRARLRPLSEMIARVQYAVD